MSCLIKRNRYFYFRVRIPADLLRYFPVAEIRKSLKTQDLKSAKLLATTLSYRAEKLFTIIRSGMLGNAQIKKIVSSFLEDSLSESEERRALGIGIPQNEDELSKLQEDNAMFLSDLKEKLAYNKTKDIEHLADNLLEDQSLSVPKDSPQYKNLCREILKTAIHYHEIEQRRLVGDYSDSKALAADLTNDIDQGKLLSEVIAEYLKEKSLKKALTPKTTEDYVGTLKLFMIMMQVIMKKEDMPFSSIDKNAFLRFVEMLSKLPANANRKKAYKGKSLEEILQLASETQGEVLSSKTRNKKVEVISSLFKWAVSQGYAVRNVAEGLTTKEDKKESEERSEYDTKDLQKLFRSEQYTSPNASPERFWIPLIALYSGMRLEEICQLYLEDVRTIDGVLCFDINKKADKGLKTRSSERIVPVHPILITIGFKRFLDTLRAKKSLRVWENLEKSKYGYGKYYGKQFGRFNRNYITKDKKKVFHSFRHNFTNNLKQQGVAETVIAELVGHSLDSITMGRYGKEYKAKVLLEAINKLDYGIDLKHLSFPV